jgi:hypothetical protein
MLQLLKQWTHFLSVRQFHPQASEMSEYLQFPIEPYPSIRKLILHGTKCFNARILQCCQLFITSFILSEQIGVVVKALEFYSLGELRPIFTDAVYGFH